MNSNEPGILRSLFDVRPDERRIVALMSTYFFLVITSFWILKPLKKPLFIGHYAAWGMDFLGGHNEAAEAELFAKVMNMFVQRIAKTLGVGLSLLVCARFEGPGGSANTLVLCIARVGTLDGGGRECGKTIQAAGSGSLAK